jgi:hypothetical protein
MQDEKTPAYRATGTRDVERGTFSGEVRFSMFFRS